MTEGSSHTSPYLSILGANEEDRFTEYLSLLLADSSFLREFLNLSPSVKLPADQFGSLRVDMQVRVEGGRPDLVISGDDTLLIYEAKVGSWIHGNQLVEYAKHIRAWKRLNPAGKTALLLIAPAAQLPGLIREAKGQVGSIKLSGIAWESIADLAAESARSARSDRTRIYLEDFAHLVAYRLGDVGRPFTAEELTVLDDQQYALSLNRVYLLTPQVVSNLEDRFGENLKTKKNNGAGFTGYDLRFGGARFWFGVWMHTWAAIGGSPLCLQVFQHIRNDLKWPSEVHEPVTGKWNGAVIPLSLVGGIERDELASGIASQVERIIKLLNPE